LKYGDWVDGDVWVWDVVGDAVLASLSANSAAHVVLDGTLQGGKPKEPDLCTVDRRLQFNTHFLF
jgi:hypothetical protein